MDRDAAAAARMTIERSLRVPMLLVALVAHVVALVVLWQGDLLIGVGVVLAVHMLWLWATLVPTSRLFGTVVTRFRTPRREVWLTIDDGPSDDTAAMLDLLDRHRARATFFLVGAHAQLRPQAVRAIVARGHGIGNHTERHPAAWFWAGSAATIAREIGAAQATLTALTGEPPRLFRAVVGMANVFVAPVLQRHRLLRIAWSARGYDSRQADAAVVTRRVLRDLRPGAIVLLHEGAGHSRSVETLAQVLEALAERDYRCVLPTLPDADVGTDGRSATTSQLLNGVPPHSGENDGVSPASRSNASSAERCG